MSFNITFITDIHLEFWIMTHHWIMSSKHHYFSYNVYHGSFSNWWGIREYMERDKDLPRVTDIFYHIYQYSYNCITLLVAVSLVVIGS